MGDYSAILFHSNNNAIWTTRVLKKNQIEQKIIPIPRHLSSDCGYCVRINRCDANKAETVIKNKGIEYDSIVEL